MTLGENIINIARSWLEGGHGVGELGSGDHPFGSVLGPEVVGRGGIEWTQHSFSISAINEKGRGGTEVGRS